MQAISPLVGVVIFLAIIVAVSFYVSGWFSTFISGLGYKTERSVAEYLAVIPGDLKIVNAYVDPYNEHVRVIVQNTGYATLKLESVAIIAKNGSVRAYTSLPNLRRGEVKALDFYNVSEAKNDNIDWIVVLASGGIGDKIRNFVYKEHVVTLFNGSYASETITFDGGENVTVYIWLPPNSTVSELTFNISGGETS